ncbi:glycosyltransferase family 4 protein [Fictibacillus nanhaiensis]|uniref:glycosyltransferase family 4 protein n=1 Tax=Fictibacillus nanhaiensis TaxID=742169 RepID=UPI001C93F49B|nr:glycosyltransferase family 4 protein [Fictibacillus nanhaiensis]MBY6036298.1 glycosyltransferase family 4 protein [Fictibacillus nanhaiensis]
MKILFAFYIPSGGVETLNRMRCKALKAQGIECHLLYLQAGSGMQNITDIPTFVMSRDREIRQLLNKQNYDCIIVCSNYLILPRIRRLGFKGHMIYEVQGLGSKESAKIILSDAKSNVLSTCNGILYPKTPHLMELIERFYQTLPRFCFHDLMDTSSFTYRKNPKPNSPIIGWVGRLEENKNWTDYLHIGHKLIQDNPAIKLWMFEDATLSKPSERNKFSEMVQQLGLSSSLVIRSNVKHVEMPDYYSMIGDSGGFLLSTSKVEGFGYAIAEAISCRCPVLTTDSDGVRTFIVHNQTGKFYPVNNIQQAVKEAQELLTNVQQREAFKINAFNHLEANCNPTLYVNHFKQMLRSLGYVL